MVILFLLLPSLFGCKKAVGLAEPASHYIRNNNSDTVIVFVHGVFGNSIDTWKVGESYWPELLTTDSTFDGTDIYVLQYPTGISSAFSIDELSDNMRLQLRDAGGENKKRVIFLAHSMGGLVVRAYLLKYREQAEKVGFIYFFSTPTEGSQLASLATLASRNPQLVNMKVNISTTYLGDLIRQWLAAGFRFPSYCAYEKLQTFGLSVVTFESGLALCNKPADPIEANHLNIVKPASKTDVSYVAFKSAYLESGKRTELRLRNLLENTVFGATTVGYAKSLLGEPVWEASGVAKFSLGNYTIFLNYSVDPTKSKEFKPPEANKILGVQAEYLGGQNSEVLALGAPFQVSENGTRLGVSAKPLGLATYSDFGVVNRIGSRPDPLTNPLRCNEIYHANSKKSELGMCCLSLQAPGRGVIMELWTRVDMPENWADIALTTPIQKLLAQLANNDSDIATLEPDWKGRTNAGYCERTSYEPNPPTSDSEKERYDNVMRWYREVPDAEIIDVLRDTRVDRVGFFRYKINATSNVCEGSDGCDRRP
jgi:hypothetical protein